MALMATMFWINKQMVAISGILCTQVHLSSHIAHKKLNLTVSLLNMHLVASSYQCIFLPKCAKFSYFITVY